jgi:hypothetical protein
VTLLLADRVLMMEAGMTAHELTVDLLPAREVGQPGLDALRHQLLTWLGVDVRDVATASA